jgi:hypothetical protein
MKIRVLQYEMSGHIAKHRFMANYLVWHRHGGVRAAAPAESNRSDDEDPMDDTSDEKVHDGTELTVLQAMMRLMGMKSKYNFSNQCYNDIMKLIIDLIPGKHNMLKDLYQPKKIVSGLGMNYEKIDVCERNCMLFWKEHKNDTKCMHYGRSRYVKVVNKDGVSVTTKVAVEQLRYTPITLRLKRLYLSEEIAK